MRWRIQASWDEGSERRSYAPFWLDSEAEALAAAEEVTETLSHFPALEVSVRLVTDHEALHERGQRLPRPLPTVHLATPSGSAPCGASLSDEHALLAPELFGLSTERRCERCIDHLA